MYEDDFNDFAKRIGLDQADPDVSLICQSTVVDDVGQISLAFEQLTRIPQIIADKYANDTLILDLSHNKLTDLRFLQYFHKMHSLILDKNTNLNLSTFPKLPALKLLW